MYNWILKKYNPWCINIYLQAEYNWVLKLDIIYKKIIADLNLLLYSEDLVNIAIVVKPDQLLLEASVCGKPNIKILPVNENLPCQKG